MKTRHSSRLHSERGSLLIVAMILCAVIGISIASYIRLGTQAQKISNRAFYNNGAINLAERGMEEAMYSINQMVNDASYTWTGWTSANSNTDMKRKWTGYTFDQNATGVVRVYVQHYDGSLAPVIITRSTVTLGGVSSAPIEKWIKVVLAMTSKFANGLVAKNRITFNGNNATVDSWNSDPDNNSATTAIKYSSTSRDDNGSVGSILVSVNAVNVNNADIWGYVATGGTPATVGNNGLVGPWGTTSGTIAAGHSSTDFSASFDAVTPPTTITVGGTTSNVSYTPIAQITSDKTLPDDFGVTAAADGKYYIEVPKITGGNTKIANGKTVVLKITAAQGSDAIKLSGNSEGISLLNTSSKLIIYTAGEISVAGQGVLNAGTDLTTQGQPVNFQIWGTATSGTQNIAVKGQGVFSGIIYAPQGSITMNGGTDTSGSIVGNDITVVGNAQFHYDESLGNFGGNPFRVAAWSELTTAADRNSYSSYLSF